MSLHGSCVDGIPVIVRRSHKRRRTISLALHPDGSIVLSAPAHTPEKFLEDFFSSRLSWVKKKIKDFAFRADANIQKCVSPAVKKHCRGQAQAFLKEKIAHYGPQLNVRPESVRINSAKSRWGSCSSKNNLNFPWRIALLPPAIIDYIVVHELAHIKEKNHGPRFWETVAGIIPDFKDSRTWLRKNSHLYRC